MHCNSYNFILISFIFFVFYILNFVVPSFPILTILLEHSTWILPVFEHITSQTWIILSIPWSPFLNITPSNDLYPAPTSRDLASWIITPPLTSCLQLFCFLSVHFSWWSSQSRTALPVSLWKHQFLTAPFSLVPHLSQLVLDSVLIKHHQFLCPPLSIALAEWKPINLNPTLCLPAPALELSVPVKAHTVLTSHTGNSSLQISPPWNWEPQCFQYFPFPVLKTMLSHSLFSLRASHMPSLVPFSAHGLASQFTGKTMVSSPAHHQISNLPLFVVTASAMSLGATSPFHGEGDTSDVMCHSSLTPHLCPGSHPLLPPQKPSSGNSLLYQLHHQLLLHETYTSRIHIYLNISHLKKQ